MNTYVDIRFQGKGFSPKRLGEITKLPIESLVESGEIAKLGRYKGQPSPYGIGLLKVDSLDNNKLIFFCDILAKNKTKINNLDEIVFDIETSQDNLSSFSISAELSKKIALLKARVEFNRLENKQDIEKSIEILRSTIASSTVAHKQRLIKMLDLIANGQDEKDYSSSKDFFEFLLFIMQNKNNKAGKVANNIFAEGSIEYKS